MQWGTVRIFIGGSFSIKCVFSKHGGRLEPTLRIVPREFPSHKPSGSCWAGALGLGMGSFIIPEELPWFPRFAWKKTFFRSNDLWIPCYGQTMSLECLIWGPSVCYPLSGFLLSTWWKPRHSLRSPNGSLSPPAIPILLMFPICFADSFFCIIVIKSYFPLPEEYSPANSPQIHVLTFFKIR